MRWALWHFFPFYRQRNRGSERSSHLPKLHSKWQARSSRARPDMLRHAGALPTCRPPSLPPCPSIVLPGPLPKLQNPAMLPGPTTASSSRGNFLGHLRHTHPSDTEDQTQSLKISKGDTQFSHPATGLDSMQLPKLRAG